MSEHVRDLGAHPAIPTRRNEAAVACPDWIYVHRNQVEEVFGWVKAAAGLRQTRHRGRERVGWCLTLATTAYNLIRLPRLLDKAPA